MSRKEELLDRFKSKPRDFRWDEFVSLMGHLGYQEQTGSGSRRKFINRSTGHVISMHKPHPSEILKSYQIKQVISALEDEGAI